MSMKLLSTISAAAIAASVLGIGAASAQQGVPATAAPPATPPAAAAPAAKAPEYVAIPMEITVNKPAADVWKKVGGYCDISKWITPAGNVPCEIKSGTGGVGTVRLIAGRVTEVLTAKTDLAYGYTQPNVEGKWYNLYHGFLEAKPIDAKSSKLVYTLMLDVSDKADQAAKDKDVASRRAQFEGALANMKKLAEAG
jgi:hypothetical protein